MARVEGEIIINRPVEEVFDFVADERNEPRYNPRLLRAEQISDGPIHVGTRFRTELKTIGRTMPMVVEFTDFQRPWRLASVTRSSMMATVGQPQALTGIRRRGVMSERASVRSHQVRRDRKSPKRSSLRCRSRRSIRPHARAGLRSRES